MTSGIIYIPILVPLFLLFLALAQPLSATLITVVDMATVLIPSAALVVGAAVVKPDWLPYAVAIAALLTGVKLLMGGGSDQAKRVADAAKARATGAAQDPTLKGAALQEKTINGGVLDSSEFQNFVLKDKKAVSHNTAVYRFALPKSTDVLGLPTGQHISLAATPAGAEKEVVRSYTPVSSDELDKGYFDLLIKTYPQGNISKHVSELKFGDTMKVKGPKGAMVYTPNMCRHIGMVAGGTGITPMLQIARAINRGRAAGDKTEVDLIFANVNEEDILVRDELDKLAKTDSRFRIHYVLNNPPENWMGGVGFVTPDMIKKSFPAPADDIKILICGPPPMVSALKKATESLGYQKARPVSKLVDQVFCF